MPMYQIRFYDNSPNTVNKGNQNTDPSAEPNQSLMGGSAQSAASVCRVWATKEVLNVGTMAAVICGGAWGVADDRVSSALFDFSATLAFSRSVALSPALGDVQLSTWCKTSVLHHSEKI